jgi:hypothetical protein
LEKHQGAEASIRSAAKQLQGEPDSIAAVKKLLKAHDEKVIFVFFSYKSKDEVAAKKVIDQLNLYSAGKLMISCMADCGPDVFGQNWRKWIKDKVSESNWFILLLPDPSDDWDWCLFETGLFERGLTTADRLICIHHPLTVIPDPIKGYHAVAAEKNKIKEFLEMAFINNNPIPGMAALNKSAKPYLEVVAENIVNAIVPPRKRPYRDIYEPWVEIQHDNPENLKNIDDLNNACIVTINKKALDLFDFLIKPKTFGELCAGLPNNAGYFWCQELANIIPKIAKGRRYYPISGLLRTKEDKYYRPVLCSVDKIGDENGPVSSYHILFVEEPTTVDGTAIPHRIYGLAIVLRFAFRFRWEVLERFGVKTIEKQDVTKLENALWRIGKDWELRGLGGEDYIQQLYPPRDASSISEIFSVWRELRTPQKDGKLDMAIKNKEVDTISRILSDVLPLNQRFLEMTADYFTQEITGNNA